MASESGQKQHSGSGQSLCMFVFCLSVGKRTAVNYNPVVSVYVRPRCVLDPELWFVCGVNQLSSALYDLLCSVDVVSLWYISLLLVDYVIAVKCVFFSVMFSLTFSVVFPSAQDFETVCICLFRTK